MHKWAGWPPQEPLQRACRCRILLGHPAGIKRKEPDKLRSRWNFESVVRRVASSAALLTSTASATSMHSYQPYTYLCCTRCRKDASSPEGLCCCSCTLLTRGVVVRSFAATPLRSPPLTFVLAAARWPALSSVMVMTNLRGRCAVCNDTKRGRVNNIRGCMPEWAAVRACPARPAALPNRCRCWRGPRWHITQHCCKSFKAVHTAIHLLPIAYVQRYHEANQNGEDQPGPVRSAGFSLLWLCLHCVEVSAEMKC